MSPREHIVIFAALGPNPAPLTELVWKLARTKEAKRFEIHVVLERSGRHYFDGELLAPGAALQQLRHALGPSIEIEDPIVHEARTDEGELLEDDAEPASFQIYAEAVWAGARAAVDAAGDRSVIFGLIAGRRRTMTALASAVFQLLARPHDRLIDVRVSDPRVEGGTGFFFPEQEGAHVQSRDGGELVDVRGVEVTLVEVEVPRLRSFVPDGAFSSFAAARAASQKVLEASAPPQVEVRLKEGEVWVDGELLPLSPSSFVWFSYLAAERSNGEGWVQVRDCERLRLHLQRVSKHEIWSKLPGDSPFALVLQGGEDDDDDLANLRTKTRKVLKQYAKGGRVALQQIVPRARRRLVGDHSAFFQRLPLDSAFIKVLN